MIRDMMAIPIAVPELCWTALMLDVLIVRTPEEMKYERQLRYLKATTTDNMHRKARYAMKSSLRRENTRTLYTGQADPIPILSILTILFRS